MSKLMGILGGGGKASAPAPATRERLMAEFGKDPAFVEDCLKNKRTMEQAWKARAEAAEAELEESKAEEQTEEEAKTEGDDAAVEPVAEPAAEPAATAAQLRAAFGDDPAFCLEQIEAGASMADAWKARAKAVQAELEKVKASARRIGPAGAEGHAGVTVSTPRAGTVSYAAGPAPTLPFATGDGHPFMLEVRRVQAADGCVYGAAVNKVVTARPDLHKAYLESRGVARK